MSLFALVLLEIDKCFKLGSGSKNRDTEIDARDILKERNIHKI